LVKIQFTTALAADFYFVTFAGKGI